MLAGTVINERTGEKSQGIPISPLEKTAFENDGLFYMQKEKIRYQL
jgi:hypothetical protein